jgi:fibronectin-binding autotransporter adhesin
MSAVGAKVITPGRVMAAQGGSITGNVTNNAVLAFNQSNAHGFDGAISGSGVVRQDGPGTTTLTATNSYTGGTALNDGTLSIANNANLDGAAGALSFDGGTLQVTGTAFTSTARTINWVANGGGFDIANAANSFTVAQAIGSGGALSKLGAGGPILTAANTCMGGTTISAGTLQLGNNGTTGSMTGNVITNSALAFSRSDTYGFDGVISGTGALQQNGTGTTTLTATPMPAGPRLPVGRCGWKTMRRSAPVR